LKILLLFPRYEIGINNLMKRSKNQKCQSKKTTYNQNHYFDAFALIKVSESRFRNKFKATHAKLDTSLSRYRPLIINNLQTIIFHVIAKIVFRLSSIVNRVAIGLQKIIKEPKSQPSSSPLFCHSSGSIKGFSLNSVAISF
jgi:hypothetical protein